MPNSIRFAGLRDGLHFDARILSPSMAEDHRGSFTKLSCDGRLADGTPLTSIREELVTVSQKGVIRGLHYQHRPAQGKWLQCLSGRVWDVAVDLRKDSVTYAQWRGLELNKSGGLRFIPAGFAHGF